MPKQKTIQTNWRALALECARGEAYGTRSQYVYVLMAQNFLNNENLESQVCMQSAAIAILAAAQCLQINRSVDRQQLLQEIRMIAKTLFNKSPYKIIEHFVAEDASTHSSGDPYICATIDILIALKIADHCESYGAPAKTQAGQELRKYILGLCHDQTTSEFWHAQFARVPTIHSDTARSIRQLMPKRKKNSKAPRKPKTSRVVPILPLRGRSPAG